MIPINIIKGEADVSDALSSFSTTPEELIDVIKNTLAVRLGCVSIDVVNAKGSLSHILGTRYLRELFIKKRWHIKRQKNVETIAHPNSGLQIAYQNVDIAANLYREPRAISAKGRGTIELVSEAQGLLFSSKELPQISRTNANSAKLNKMIWYLCVSFHEDETVSAELSLPKMITNGNFDGFHERIFLIENSNYNELRDLEPRQEADRFEIEPIIKRKK